MKNNNVKDWVKYSGLGFRMMAVILVMVLAGRWLDNHFELERPWCTITGALISVPLSLYSAMREFLKK